MRRGSTRTPGDSPDDPAHDGAGAAGRLRAQRWLAGGALAALVAGALPGAAAPAAAAGRLLGDLGGWRSRVERLGLAVDLYGQAFPSWKSDGGADPDERLGHSASYDLLLRADLEELAGLRGLSALLHVKGQYDRSLNHAAGALSDPVDDADFDCPVYVDELWFEEQLLDGRVRLRLGFLEQQTVFDRNAFANSEDRQFSATALDNDLIVPLPNGLGATLVLAPTPRVELALGVADADNVPRRPGFDTAFDDFPSLTSYAELSIHTDFSGPAGPLPGTLRIGALRDGRRRTLIGRQQPGTGAPETARGHPGAWASFDQLVLREPGPGEQGLGIFARLGWADPAVSPIGWFASLGARYRGALPGRDADEVALGAWRAWASDRLRGSADFGRETGFELYYRVAVQPWLDVTPGVQWILDPGAVPGAPNVVVAVLRFRVSL